MPAPKREYKFHEKRKWKIDWCWPDVKLAIEIEGGVWLSDGGGRHNRPKGYINDMEKYNAMQEAGWLLLRYVPDTKEYTKGKPDYEQIARVYHRLKEAV